MHKAPPCKPIIVTFFSIVKSIFSKDNRRILWEGVAILISYAPLWKTMENCGETTYTLINKYGISARTIHNLKHNKSITMYTLERLCAILHCQAEAVVIFTQEKAD